MAFTGDHTHRGTCEVYMFVYIVEKRKTLGFLFLRFCDYCSRAQEAHKIQLREQAFGVMVKTPFGTLGTPITGLGCGSQLCTLIHLSNMHSGRWHVMAQVLESLPIWETQLESHLLASVQSHPGRCKHLEREPPKGGLSPFI